MHSERSNYFSVGRSKCEKDKKTGIIDLNAHVYFKIICRGRLSSLVEMLKIKH